MESINERTKAYIDGLSLFEQDQVYRYLWKRYVEEDVASHAADEDISLSDGEIEFAADYIVNEGEYDCDLGYWVNIENAIDKAKAASAYDPSTKYSWIELNHWGIVQNGKATEDQIQKMLIERRPEAEDVLEKHNADHVVYGIKFYNMAKKLITTHFYMHPMTDAEFNAYILPLQNAMVYAVHRIPDSDNSNREG